MRLLNVVQASQELNCSKYSLRKWIKEGMIQVVRLGRAIRIRSTEVDQIISEGKLTKK